MKKLTFLFIPVFCSLLICAGICYVPCGWAAEKNKPVLAIDNPTFKSGTIWAGEKIRHNFKVSNKGPANLNILKVESSCECSTASFDSTIPSGKKGRIAVEIKTDDLDGDFEKEFLVYSNDPSGPRLLVVSGHARRSIKVEPEKTILLQGSVKEKLTGKVRLISSTGKSFKITGVKNRAGDKISSYIQKIVDGKTYEIVVQNVLKKPGRYSEFLIISTDCPSRPEIVLTIFGNITN